MGRLILAITPKNEPIHIFSGDNHIKVSLSPYAPVPVTLIFEAGDDVVILRDKVLKREGR